MNVEKLMADFNKAETNLGKENVTKFWDFVNKTEWGKNALTQSYYYDEIRKKFPMTEEEGDELREIGVEYYNVLKNVMEELMTEPDIVEACVDHSDYEISEEEKKEIEKQMKDILGDKIESQGFQLLNDIRINEDGDLTLPLGLGDDSRYDLIWHIIGCGRDKVLEVINNPREMFRMAQNDEFTECFSYCFYQRPAWWLPNQEVENEEAI